MVSAAVWVTMPPGVTPIHRRRLRFWHSLRLGPFSGDHNMLWVGVVGKSATYDECGRHKSTFCTRQNGVKNAPKTFKNVQKRSTLINFDKFRPVLTSFAHFYVNVCGLECIRPALAISPGQVGIFQSAQNDPTRPKTGNTYVECPRHKSFLRAATAATTCWGAK